MIEAAVVLRRARARIATPERWTRGAFARDQAGRPVPATSRRARSWCVAGALLAEISAPLAEAERRPVVALALAVQRRAFALLDAAAPGPAPRLSPAAWLNNTASHEEVLAMLDRAILSAE